MLSHYTVKIALYPRIFKNRLSTWIQVDPPTRTKRGNYV